MNLKTIPLWIVANPIVSAVIILVITAFFALQLPRLEIDASAEGLMVQNDPARTYYEEIKKKFGSDNLTVVVIKAKDVFSQEVLQTIQRLSNTLQGSPGVSRVESLTTVNNIKGEGDFLNTDPLVGADVPGDSKKLGKIRSDTLGNPIFINNIVAKDGKVTAINVYTEAKAGDKTFNTNFVKTVDSLIAKEKHEGVEMYQVGTPLTKVTLGDYIFADVTSLVPLAIIFLLGTLLISFRSFQACVIPMITGLVSIIWVLGLMVLLDIPINVITAIVPALMIAIGFTEDTHMISEYHNKLEVGMAKMDALREMSTEAALPVLITTFTTVVGFGSNALSNITMISQFGMASAVGLTANWIISAVLVSVTLLYWRVPKVHKAEHRTEDGRMATRFTLFMNAIGAWNLRWRKPISIVTVALTALCMWGAYKLEVNTDFISFFKEDTFIRKRVKDIHESLSGVVNFYVVVETGKDDLAKDPDTLLHVAKLQDYLKSLKSVDNTISLANYIRVYHREMNGGKPEFEVVPDKRELIAQYLLTLDNNEISKYVDFNYSTLNIAVRHNISSSSELTALLDKIKAYTDKNFPKNLKVQFTGEGILINNAADYMAFNQITSFGQTFLIIGLIHAALFMSFKAGFLSLLPNIVPIFYILGIMGFLGIPFDVGTSLVATIALGIAVDDTVHHMVHYSRELNEVHDQEIAMYRTLESEGRPIIYSSIALAAGFGILAFSNFVPIWEFAILSAVAMILAMFTELSITPILVVSTRLVSVWDTLLAKMNKDIVGTTPIFQNFWLWEAKKVAVMGKLTTFKKGETMVRKGEVGNEMYLIISGKAGVTDSGPQGKVIKNLPPGEIFGEMA
ncbi:MAG TPA: hypothetical protein DCZ05_12875, partial [Deltaproteobacteria bacterium]|nr:hypothetical protein [Deltaproteobacteria bacterium]